ncbi:hypothetical protein PBI_MANGETHE_53 [Mycobacterium phage Mangethe]|uniref:VUT family protein n=1 Tax=Mycobacterium phage Majeke TaxID=2024296 RepID=A0A249XTJ3_9CAUD|nr:hypothetical protein I5J48_gp53 [Mycobacterium phage Majeke]ASZ75313.1 hypothetical protein PBI_MAJEKE_53 [Mycobacterium phage Majeke]AYQ99886.1 hypothetical protein PBI_MANGETHE_53 [Mycobacterium phage Mangethe]QBI97987.1 hypothetical protein SEA_ZILIZEBETH_53 [Mycobacterium phage Zilizebeth]URP21038.1 hypothetical protein SEA_PHEGASUS_53 [Mycobacterium phage Phegasus]
MSRAIGTAFGALFVGTVLVANWATSTFGFVPVGFGQAATAGTFAAGFALAARDVVQDQLGKRWMLALLAAAALLSYLVADPHIATASAVAFLVSELLDFAVYSPLRARARRFGDWRWTSAVLASGAVGAIADTVVFVGIAFGVATVSVAMLGQLIGKAYATAAYAVIGRVTGALFREPHKGSARA